LRSPSRACRCACRNTCAPRRCPTGSAAAARAPRSPRRAPAAPPGCARAQVTAPHRRPASQAMPASRLPPTPCMCKSSARRRTLGWSCGVASRGTSSGTMPFRSSTRAGWKSMRLRGRSAGSGSAPGPGAGAGARGLQRASTCDEGNTLHRASRQQYERTGGAAWEEPAAAIQLASPAAAVTRPASEPSGGSRRERAPAARALGRAPTPSGGRA